MKVAFDSRPAGSPRHRALPRCLLDALRETAAAARSWRRTARGVDVFHAPWIDGALLRPRARRSSPCTTSSRSSAAASTCGPACAFACATSPSSARLA